MFRCRELRPIIARSRFGNESALLCVSSACVSSLPPSPTRDSQGPGALSYIALHVYRGRPAYYLVSFLFLNSPFARTLYK